ncbi:hypothetical protein F52700_6607 [Fusarium sp. NRRL 52700]|nr:hypothetical protein F52700_6607 [Fusarium sp. NRRL 52700]
MDVFTSSTLTLELTSTFSGFTAENSGHLSRLRALKSFLDARPQVKPVTDLLPANIDEMNARLDLIEAVRNKIITFEPDRPPLNHLQFSYLMGMPLVDLQRSAYSGTGHVVEAVHGLGKFTAYFFNSQRSFAPSPTGILSTRSQRSQVQQTQTTINECKRLDQHRCIVTGLADPQVCHIVPFAWNQSQEHLEKTRKLLRKVDYLFIEKNAEASETIMEIIKGVKSSDKPWNVLCVSPQLHTWWGKAFFGFKYQDAVLCEDDPNYSIISLQFVWMPSNVKAMPTDQIDLKAQRNSSTALGAHLNHRYGQGPLSACTTCRETLGVKCHDISSNRPIESGTIIKVKRLTEHRGFFEHVIKLQWSIIRAAAMSGGPLTGDDSVSSDCGEEEMGHWEEEEQDDSINKFNKWLELISPEVGTLMMGLMMNLGCLVMSLVAEWFRGGWAIDIKLDVKLWAFRAVGNKIVCFFGKPFSLVTDIVERVQEFRTLVGLCGGGLQVLLHRILVTKEPFGIPLYHMRSS